MDEGVPREHAAERTVVDGQGFGSADPVALIREGGPGALDEFRHRIDARDVHAKPGEMVRPLPGAAPNVKHRPIDTARPSLDECQVRRGHVVDATDDLDVLTCSRSIRAANRLE